MLTREGQLIVPPTQQKQHQLTETIPGTSMIDFHEQKQRVIINLSGKAYPIQVFDHVQVQVLVSLTRSHLPQIKLSLSTFASTKTLIKLGDKNAKSIYVDSYKQSTIQEQERALLLEQEQAKQNQIKLDTIVGYASGGGVYKKILEYDQQQPVQCNQLEPEPIPVPVIPRYSRNQLLHKKRILEQRIEQGQNVQQYQRLIDMINKHV